MFKLLLMIVLTFFFGKWKDTVGIQWGYSKNTVRIQWGYSEDTAKIQWGYSEDTVRRRREYKNHLPASTAALKISDNGAMIVTGLDRFF